MLIQIGKVRRQRDSCTLLCDVDVLLCAVMRNNADNPLKPRSPSNCYTLCHTGLTYQFLISEHSGTLALSPERQSARMSEIKN